MDASQITVGSKYLLKDKGGITALHNCVGQMDNLYYFTKEGSNDLVVMPLDEVGERIVNGVNAHSERPTPNREKLAPVMGVDVGERIAYLKEIGDADSTDIHKMIQYRSLAKNLLTAIEKGQRRHVVVFNKWQEKECQWEIINLVTKQVVDAFGYEDLAQARAEELDGVHKVDDIKWTLDNDRGTVGILIHPELGAITVHRKMNVSKVLNALNQQKK